MSDKNVNQSPLEQKRSSLQAENEKLNNEISGLEDEKKKLYDQNHENVDARNEVKGKKSTATTLLVIASVVGFILFAAMIGKGAVPTIIAIVALIAAIAVDVLQFKKIMAVKPDCERLDKLLEEYDAQVAERDGKIKTNKETIAKNDEKLALIDLEIKTEELQNSGCICVYTSHHFYKTSLPSYPVKNEGNICTHGIVSIDGLQMGVVQAPFAVFKVKPGTHVVTVQVPFFEAAADFSDAIKHGGSSEIYDPKRTIMTTPEQVTIKDGQSKVLYIQMGYKSCMGGEYVHYESREYKEQYSSVAKFLSDTNQAKYALPEIPILPE